jgi:membrane associated rhomboid family serine protease
MTLYIIIITCLISLIAFSQPKVMDALIFDPSRIQSKKEYYRFVTCGLLHGDYFHLFVNMFVLYSFGQAVEYYYGKVFGETSGILFLVLYITSIFAANVSTYFKHRNHPSYKALGASGAVSAIVFTSILFAPFTKIYLYGIIGLPGILLGGLYLVYSYYMSHKDAADNINHDAHWQGAVYGILFTIALKPVVIQIFLNQLF